MSLAPQTIRMFLLKGGLRAEGFLEGSGRVCGADAQLRKSRDIWWRWVLI